MKQQAFNPYLPLYEYIPDGEPRVFGDRVYIFGSHDRFGGMKFCLNDYICYSAPVTDLSDWRYEGVIYKRTQDPRTATGKHQLWAPDVIQGKDGRYYLYYCPDDKIKSIGVAVCGTPAGKYEFLGVVRDKDGGIIGERTGDTIQFDPSVFIDGDGTVYLYSGNGPRIRGQIGKEPKASVVMTLEDDMVTIKTEPKKLLPILGEENGTGFEGHEFLEASSVRKVNGRYYLVYSSVKMHELCYAVSERPNRDYRFGGVIISNCDVFEGTDRNKPINCIGNNHGGMENINGKWYIFYHRQTNGTMFSRQGCAEEIQFSEDGSISQIEVTSCGLNQVSLNGIGAYSSGLVCNLYGAKPPAISHPLAMRGQHPFITQDKPDYEPGGGTPVPKQYITNGKNGMTAGFKYFNFAGLSEISVTIRGTAKGTLAVRTAPNGKNCAEISVTPCKEWREFRGAVSIPDGIHAVFFCYEGKGKLDFLKFEFI
ncbi:MAG: family 43 glycosylhydrolase [Oscillospiraceae bacterium]|nr:family 43 glycosylhydrolase [Oscillospiraceae bacterium]